MLRQLLVPSAELNYAAKLHRIEQGTVFGSCCMADIRTTLQGQWGQGG